MAGVAHNRVQRSKGVRWLGGVSKCGMGRDADKAALCKGTSGERFHGPQPGYDGLMMLMILPPQRHERVGIQQESHIVSASSVFTSSLVMTGAPFGARKTRKPSLDLTNLALGPR